MTETLITFQNAALIGLTCLVSGMFCGAGAFAAALEIFDKEREPQMDYEAIQTELDNEFGTPAEVIAARMVR
ncbi:hypothetical protein [Ensifer adhaerens]|uniref:hypothetical protein n=1 Tax=Ensifer adhaerens TaxID=106592 RepID=UPI000DC602E4|nr:hypothetical protein [Ensifer adhaerens]RAS13522.1 hypothetical protein DEU52_106120 [Ensifer adhaerens]